MDAARDEARSAAMFARLGRGRATMLAGDETPEGGEDAPFSFADYYPVKGESKRAVGPAVWAFLGGVALTLIACKAAK